jgi:pimeloyl-ACP methyl ester carboxylesterase
VKPAYVETRLGRVHYHETGAGTPLVLLHGGRMDSRFWLRLAPLLAQEMRVLAPDMAPAGLSEPQADEPASLAAWGEAVVAFLDALGIERASVCGFHIGAAVAVDVAARAPDRVDRLIPLGLLAVATQTDREEFYERTGHSTEFDDAESSDPEWVVRDFLEHADPSDPEWYSIHLESRLRLGSRSWWAYRASFAFDIARALQGVRAPTLFLYLTGDVLDREIADLATATVPGSDVEWLEGSAYLPLSDPAPLATALLAFLD